MRSPDKKPYIIGVTGGIGSGKSTVTGFFAAHGIIIIDADVIARTIVEQGKPSLNSIEKRYGKTILSKDGRLDRKRVRGIIFKDLEEKIWLEKLLHPEINNLIRQKLTTISSPYGILSSPLLIKTSLHQFIDRILIVDVSEEIQLERTVSRDNVAEEQVQAIIKSQPSREYRLKFADDIVDNSGLLNELYKAVNNLHILYLQLAQE
ncbi:MAG: dephospho-CoA kinase [Candidatus Endonucleobacter bathymodioli]|uniref:Dephospho-CoA kinase n=1 Tax=Candidatus Endonucleibacter bathymodioli TaxID=539814 RepID=A0AA90SSN1_9GAMM|nr:dephospho-CoA kinase [Candidatus Endonucleobacter bathymodioli]